MWLNNTVQQTWGLKENTQCHAPRDVAARGFSNRNKTHRFAHMNSWEVKNADNWVMDRDSDLTRAGCSLDTGICPFPAPLPSYPQVILILGTFEKPLVYIEGRPTLLCLLCIYTVYKCYLQENMHAARMFCMPSSGLESIQGSVRTVSALAVVTF